MALRRSTAYAQLLADGFSEEEILRNTKIEVYTGGQPATADLAPTGTKLVTFSVNGSAITAEVRPTAIVTLTGAGGQVDTLKVAGIDLFTGPLAYTTDLTTTAAALATAVNAYRGPIRFTATSALGVLTIKAPKNIGTLMAGLTVACTVSGGTLAAAINGGSSSTLGGTGSTAGVANVNGLRFAAAVDGVLAKDASAWQGTAINTGTAGWFRCVCDPTDDASDNTTTKLYPRLDGTIGSDMTVTNTAITSGQVQTVTQFQLTVPKQ